MSSEETKKIVEEFLTPPDYANVAIRIRLDEFLKFSGRMNEQLEQLVAPWGHAAAPSARRSAPVRR